MSTLGSWAIQKRTGAVLCGLHAAIRPTSKFQLKAGGSLPEPCLHVEDTFGDELLHVKAWHSGQSRGNGHPGARAGAALGGRSRPGPGGHGRSGAAPLPRRLVLHPAHEWWAIVEHPGARGDHTRKLDQSSPSWVAGPAYSNLGAEIRLQPLEMVCCLGGWFPCHLRDPPPLGPSQLPSGPSG